MLITYFMCIVSFEPKTTPEVRDIINIEETEAQ